MKNLVETFFGVVEQLEASDIAYMVVGSVASMVYGEPRMTHDMNLVVELAPGDVDRFEKLFPFERFYCPPIEVLRSEAVTRGQFNLLHHETGLKVDVIMRKDTEHGKAEFARRRKMPFWEGREAFLASPEDVIIKKLDYFRQGGSTKHLADIRGILALTEVDQAYLDHWIDKLGLAREWEQV